MRRRADRQPVVGFLVFCFLAVLFPFGLASFCRFYFLDFFLSAPSLCCPLSISSNDVTSFRVLALSLSSIFCTVFSLLIDLFLLVLAQIALRIYLLFG